jgi:hypothetical protein
MKQCCYVICFLIIGCNNSELKKNNTLSEKVIDSTKNLENDIDSNSVTLTINEMLDDWSARYKDSLTIDTSFSIGGKSVHLQIKNYCLFDSSINVPEVYLSHLRMKKFVSNNFASSVLMEIDNKIIVDTIIDKSLFLDLLLLKDRTELYDYGALLFSRIEIKNDRCKIAYTIGVPLSDVGSNFDANVFYNGKIEAVETNFNE